MEFSTFDNDHDKHANENCAAYHGGGGNWMKSCSRNNMNGKYGRNGDEGDQFMFWYCLDGDEMALKTMTLMFRQAD